MPVFIFQHPNTEEILEVVQKISEPHKYVDNEGVEWNRVFTVPHASVPFLGTIDPNCEKDFTYKTGKTSGTVGDLWDMSKELSDKRKSQNDNNVDPIKKENFKNYSKKRKGIKHPQDKSKG